MAFSSPYSALAIGVFGPDASGININAPGDLKDQTIAVARGTTQDLELTASAPDAKITRFDDDATAAAAFLSGQAELLATANVVARDLMEKNPGVELKARFILRYAPTYIGVQQSNPEILRWLDTFVFCNMLTGELSDITEKWLGQPLPEHFPSLWQTGGLGRLQGSARNQHVGFRRSFMARASTVYTTIDFDKNGKQPGFFHIPHSPTKMPGGQRACQSVSFATVWGRRRCCSQETTATNTKARLRWAR